ncbi:WhiB family transcriptional regulator [Streptomyces pharetrae]|uniref:WhiB family transcriptional regulator n=1 Tax=Streptomyces pharetrae TaxID=291370 RepID=UPI003349AD56
MTYTGVTRPTGHTQPAPRFPFPHHPAPTRFQTEPTTFDFANGDRSGGTRAAAERRLARARRACSGCPIVTDCLKWALVNKNLAKVGIFAATTPAQCTALRKRMVDRLGPDWIDALADQDQARREQAATVRHTPLTISHARIVRLDRETNEPTPQPLAPTAARPAA